MSSGINNTFIEVSCSVCYSRNVQAFKKVHRGSTGAPWSPFYAHEHPCRHILTFSRTKNTPKDPETLLNNSPTLQSSILSSAASQAALREVEY